MSIQKYKESLYQDRRKKYFQKVRLQVLSSLQEQNIEKNIIPSTYDGQQEIFQAFRQYRQHGQYPNFIAINKYICQYEHPLEEDFKKQLISMVFQHFKNNGHAIASCAHMLSKSEKRLDYISELKISKIIQQLLTCNIDFGTSKLRNGRELVYLIYYLLVHSQDKQSFISITAQYNVMINTLGHFDLIMLLLLAEASNYRFLLINKNLALSYLSAETPYGIMDEQAIFCLFDMLQNYIRFAQDTNLYMPFIAWMERGLKQSKLQIILKIDFINMLTMILKAESVNRQQFDQIAKMSIFNQIILIARFDTIQNKKLGLQCLNYLINKASVDVLDYYIDNHSLLETLVYALQMQLQTEQIFNILCSIILILHNKDSYYKKVLRLGLLNYINMYRTSKYVKLSQVSNLIIQCFQSSLMNRV